MAQSGRIEAHDIIDHQSILDRLNEVKNGLEGLKAELQSVSQVKKIELRSIISTAGMEKAATAISSLVDAMAKLNDAAQQNNAAIQAVTAAQVRAAAVNKLNAEANAANAQAQRTSAAAAAASARATAQATRAAEGARIANDLLAGRIKELADLSYNQLSAAYSHLSAELKKMSANTIQSTDANRQMAAMTKNVRDAMNEAQKAMGNYSLNVGRYHTAFDGLGFSIQQVMREIPSAINISQFFLAISNNIPMVVDQLQLFKAEQEDLKKQLSTMTAGTKEYMELQSKQMSVGQKLFKSVFNWQSAVIAGIILLRKYGEAIVNKITSWFSIITRNERLLNEVNKEAASTVGQLTAGYVELQKEWKSLSDGEKDKWVKQHADALRDLNVPLNSVQDAENAFVNNTQDVIKAIDARARSVAAMKVAAEKYEKAFAIRQQAEADLKNGKMTFGGKVAYGAIAAGSSENGMPTPEQLQIQEAAAAAYAKKKYNKEIGKAEEIEKEAYDIITKWALPDAITDKEKGRSKKTPKEKIAEYVDFFKEMMTSRSEVIKDSYESEIEAERNRASLEAAELESEYKAKEKALAEYCDQQKMSEKEKEAYIKMLHDQYIAIDVANANAHQKKLDEINKKWVDIYAGDKTKQTKDEIKQIQDINEARLNAANIKANTVGSEIARNNALIQNIKILKQEEDQLLQLQEQGATTADGITAIADAIDRVREKISRSKANMSFSKRLKADNLTIADVLGAVMTEDGKKGIMGRAGFNDEEIQEMIERGEFDEDFKQYMDSMLSGLKNMKDATMEYVDDMINAWVKLAEARAAAAAEETDAAQEEYDRQKSLMDAGYANSMETAWAEYQEKKQIQEQAERDAKNAAEMQEKLNTATQVSELITAVAKIFSSMAKGGPVGVALAAAASAAMISSFIASKSMAARAAQYGEGHVEYVGYGGTHASGHDNPLAYDAQGRERRMERGEIFGVISRRSIAKYGRNTVLDLFNSVNRGTYEADALNSMSRQQSVALMPSFVGHNVRLDKIESQLALIGSNTSSQTFVTKDGAIVRKSGNNTIITRTSK